MRQRITGVLGDADTYIVAGLALVAIGAGMIYIPAALISSGIFLVVIGWLLGAPHEQGQAEKPDEGGR